MSSLRAVPPCSHPGRTFYVNRDLFSESHVFVCHDAVCKPLQAPYDGSYRVINRTKKHFTLDIMASMRLCPFSIPLPENVCHSHHLLLPSLHCLRPLQCQPPFHHPALNHLLLQACQLSLFTCETHYF